MASQRLQDCKHLALKSYLEVHIRFMRLRHHLITDNVMKICVTRLYLMLGTGTRDVMSNSSALSYTKSLVKGLVYN